HLSAGILRRHRICPHDRDLDPESQFPLRRDLERGLDPCEQCIGVDLFGRALGRARPRRCCEASSSIFPRGCVGSSPVWFAKFSSSEPAKTGLVAQSAPAIEAYRAKSKIDCLTGRVQTRARLKIGFAMVSQLTSSWRGFSRSSRDS